MNPSDELIYRDNRINTEITKPDDFRKFYENYINNQSNLEDKDDKGEAFYQDQFYLYIKKQVNNFLYGEKDNIVLLLGAGASVLGEKWKYGKTMSRLACEIINELYCLDDEQSSCTRKDLLSFDDFTKLSNISDPDDLEEIVKDTLNINKSKNTGNSNNKGNNKTFELENFISTLNQIINLSEGQIELFNSEDSSNYVQKVKNTRNEIQKQILRRVTYTDYPFDDEEDSFQHLSIMKLLMSKLDKDDSKLEVVTTNYDKVIEKAAERGKITIFDGFGFNSDPVFNDSWFDWNLSKRAKNLNSNEVEYNPNVIDLLKIHGSVDWFRTEGDIVKKIIKPGDENETPVMIFPSSDKYKQSYDKPYFELMSRFQNILRKPNTLLITSGFSFGDEHISRMIIDAVKINSGLRVLVTDHSIGNSLNSKKNKFSKIKTLISNNYDVALLKATMNNKDENYGLHFYLN